jgi:hypothetical protein
MSFLAPLFLLGALAVGLPILFHLIRHTTRARQLFSSLMFLRETPPRITRRSRLENLLLLLLRCAVIGLLALGFARPFLERPVPVLPTTAPPEQLVVLLDTSASMRREGLWPSALSKAEEVLRRAGPGDEVAVLSFDRQARAVVGFEQWRALAPADRAALSLERVRGLRPGWASTHLGQGLLAAAEALSEADPPAQALLRRRIVLITDLQEGARLDGLQGYDWPTQTTLVVEKVQPKRPTNAGLQWVMDDLDTVQSGAATGPRLRVSNSSDAEREQFQLRWDGLPDAPPLEVYVPPGQSRVVQWPQPPAGPDRARLVLTGDEADFDNAVQILQPQAERWRLWFLGADAADDPTQLLYYLTRAFPSTRREAVEVIARDARSAVGTAALGGARLVLLADEPSASWVAELRAYLQGGGTVLVVLRSAGGGRAVGSLAGEDSLVVAEAPGSDYALLGQIDFQHPLFAPFADPRYSDFSKIHFWKHRRLPAEGLSNARVVARFDNGDPSLLELPVGKGRLWILTAGWHPADSQLALSSKFVPLLHAFAEQAGGVRAPVAQYRVGDEVAMPAAMASAPATVLRPDGATVLLAGGSDRFGQTDLPGVYTVTGAGAAYAFVVNLDPAESKTAPRPMDDLEQLGVPLQPTEPSPVSQAALRQRRAGAELENEQKLWRWLIIAALVVLVFETWLAGRQTRRTGAGRDEALA